MTGPVSSGSSSGDKSEPETTVCLIAEVIGNGPTFDAAVEDAINRLARAGTHVKAVDVVGHKLSIHHEPKGVWIITSHRVVLKVAYDGKL